MQLSKKHQEAIERVRRRFPGAQIIEGETYCGGRYQVVAPQVISSQGDLLDYSLIDQRLVIAYGSDKDRVLKQAIGRMNVLIDGAYLMTGSPISGER